MRILLVMLCSVILGCATPQTGIRMADAGPKPSEEQATEAIKAWLYKNLKDPDSLKQFRVRSGPDVISWFRGWVNGGGYEEAWLYCFEYNAKNSYGGYAGLKVDGLAIRSNGEELRVVPNVNWIISNRRC